MELNIFNNEEEVLDALAAYFVKIAQQSISV
jgi:hypothetical protein